MYMLGHGDGEKNIPIHGRGCCKGHRRIQFNFCSSSRVKIYKVINKSL